VVGPHRLHPGHHRRGRRQGMGLMLTDAACGNATFFDRIDI
jgi:hypothetical protein